MLGRRVGRLQSRPDLTGGALARWFSQMLTEPLGVTTDRVELTWELQGRRYFATYTRPTGRSRSGSRSNLERPTPLSWATATSCLRITAGNSAAL
jgi:hypothetical protein